LTPDEIINNAIEQEQKGIEPLYYLRDSKGGFYPGAGWLVWSTWDDGAGVVFKKENGTYSIITGWQADFIYN
jgi:hypothetical protein